ncbi:hypothetical protein SteCoe_19732 [Stentor coeruleus]|uniref:Uncharacterized protein n=1 Tax=Stentor coeruleus TaxID=5963 RepID=A0A1R2BU31_9CILI|nr:hypothetical protein SteCoe_19732 [Stentor coeruleus]
MNDLLKKCNKRSDICELVKSLNTYGLRVEGHFRAVTCIAVNKDNKIFASGSADLTVRIWDVVTRKQIMEFVGHSSEINALAIGQGSKIVVSGSGDNTIRSDNRVFVWDIVNMSCKGSLKGHSKKVQCILITSNGKYAISGGSDSIIIVWDLEKMTIFQACFGHKNSVNSILCTKTHLISASSDHKIIFWDINSYQLVNIFHRDSTSLRNLAYYPLFEYIIWSSDKNICIYSILNRQKIIELQHFYPITSLCVSEKLDLLISLSIDSNIIVWDLRTFNQRSNFQAPHGCLSLAFSCEKYIITSYSDRRLKVYDIDDFGVGLDFSGHLFEVSCIKPSKDFSMLATGSRDCSVRVWDTLTCIEKMCFSGHSMKITCLDFTEDNGYLISGSVDSTVQIINLRTGMIEHVMNSHENAVNCILTVWPVGIYSASDHDSLIKTTFTKNVIQFIHMFSNGKINSMQATKSKKLLVCGFNHMIRVFLII